MLSTPTMTRMPASASRSRALLLQSLPATSPSSTRKTNDALSFKEQGFQFIPVRRAHLDFFGFVFGEEPPAFEACIGNTMVDRDFLPLGFCLAWMRETGAVTSHAYFGHWLRTYPKDILRGMKGTMDKIRSAGVSEVYAFAELGTPGSVELIKWFGGVETDQPAVQGNWWRIDLTRSPI